MRRYLAVACFVIAGALFGRVAFLACHTHTPEPISSNSRVSVRVEAIPDGGCDCACAPK